MTASEPYCAYSTQRIFMKCQSVHIIPHCSSKGFTPFRAECEGLSWSSLSFTVCEGVPSPLCYSLLNTHPSQRCSDTVKSSSPHPLVLFPSAHIPVSETLPLCSCSTCVYCCSVVLEHVCVPLPCGTGTRVCTISVTLRYDYVRVFLLAKVAETSRGRG